MTPAPASDADALASATAARYAGRWAGAVARQVDGDDAAGAPAPWFVDGFAGADLQRAALRGASPRPAALLAVQALDDAVPGCARIVLIEEDPGLLARLHELLDGMGAGPRVRASSDPAGAEPGEILLVESGFAAHAHRLAQRMGGDAALVRLAPLAARGLPWTALEPVAALPATDVLLRVPHEDFQKQARFAGPLADLPPHLRRVVEGCSGFLGDARYGWLAAWREAQRTGGADAALATAVQRMQARLAAAADDRQTHAVRVDGGPEPVHLLLSTPFAGHPAELDAALAHDDAPPRPSARRKSAAPAKRAALPEPSAADRADPPTPPAGPAEPEPGDEPSAALDLFGLAEEAQPAPHGPDLAAFADDLHAHHAGTRVGVRDLMDFAAGAGVSPEQLRAALAGSRRTGRVSYRSLDGEDAEVEFLAHPRPAAPRPRKPRTPPPGLLGLFDEPED